MISVRTKKTLVTVAKDYLKEWEIDWTKYRDGSISLDDYSFDENGIVHGEVTWTNKNTGAEIQLSEIFFQMSIEDDFEIIQAGCNYGRLTL